MSVDPSASLNVLSLFSGVGGLDQGFRLALPAARTVAYVEAEAYCCAVLAARMQDGSLDDAPLFTDVRTFDGRPWRGLVDAVIGGPPCQDISVAGRGAGIKHGTRSGLWYEMARIIEEVNPSLVFIENVSAIIGRGLDIVLDGLAALGLDAEWITLPAAAVGAPHKRERFFCLAYRPNARWSRGSGESGAESAVAARCKSACRDDVVYRPSDRQQQPGQARERWFGDPNHRGQLADTGCERDQRRQRPEALAETSNEVPADLPQQRLRGAAGDGGADMVHATGERLEGRRQDLQPEWVGVDPLHGETGRDVGNPHSSRLQGRGLRGGERSDERAAWRPSSPLPIFPPGPSQRNRWRVILQHHPELAPALESSVRGVASIVPTELDASTRIDRLRSLGNSVVPVQAAVALRILLHRAGLEALIGSM